MKVAGEKCHPIAQAAVLLLHGEKYNADSSKRLLAILFSEPAREVLKRFGY